MSLVGNPAPSFRLSDTAGTLHTGDALWGERPALLVFYKSGCPTCQLALPLVEPMFQAYGARMAVVGISQDDVAATQAFAAAKGLTFPILVDSPDYAVSRQFGLTHVPTFILVEPGGQVARRFQGWDRDAVNELSATLAAGIGLATVIVSSPADGLPVFQPG